MRRHQEQANAHVLDEKLIVNLKDMDRTVAILVVSQSIQFVPLKEDGFTKVIPPARKDFAVRHV